MKKQARRFLSLILAVVFTLSLYPPLSVSANSQNPVTALVIGRAGTASGNSYPIRLNWTDAMPAAGADPHIPEGYRIQYENRTRGGGLIDAAPVGPGTETDTTSYNLLGGSLYEFRVAAWHMHNPPPPASATTIWSTNDPTVLYLTDIEVEAESLGGGQVRVTWDDPKYGNADAITGWTLYYDLGTGFATGQPTTNPIPISITNPGLSRVTIGGVAKYQYTFTDNTMSIGQTYTLRVVPSIPGGTLIINGAPKQCIASGNDYKATFTEVPYIWLETDTPGTVKVRWNKMNPTPPIDRIDIFSRPVGSTSPWTNIGTIFGPTNTATTDFWVATRPSVDTEYYITVHPESPIVPVDSNIVLFTPAFADFLAYSPTIFDETYRPQPPTLPLSIDFKFLAFLRDVYDTANELPNPVYDNRYVDLDVVYNIWVTDDIRNFDVPAMPPIRANINGNTIANILEAYKQNPSQALNEPVFNLTNGSPITTYYTNDNAFAAPVPLDDNKVYFIKITAELASYPTPPTMQPPASYASVFIPPAGDISKQPIMISSPPVRIKRDADGMEEITQTSIAIEWDTIWDEIYNAADNRWYPTGTPKEQEAVDNWASAGLTGTPPTRNMDLSAPNIGYKIHVVPYDDMLSGYADYEAYINMELLDPPPTDASSPLWNSAWTDITPQGTNLLKWHEITGLNPNTPYVIFLRPYQIGGYAAYYPTYVTATTLDPQAPLYPIPTTPVLEVVKDKTTDMSITVRFTFVDDPDLEYNLYYAELPQNWAANTGTLAATNAQIRQYGTKVTETNPATGRDELYMYYTIDNLFPETPYYFWVTVTSNFHGITKKSNPDSDTTKELSPPKPPRGFGYASENSLRVYNAENGTNYTPFGQDYLVYEWMRDSNDNKPDTYPDAFVSVPDGRAEALLSDLLPSNLLMGLFNGLTPNKMYYARARTVLTVTKDSNGVIERIYSYQVQVSEEADFRNVIELTVPPIEGEPQVGRLVRKFSEWTDTITIYTNLGGDYDGYINEKHYPLPSKNYEILYDPVTKTLTYRFRANEKDEDGNNDNQVDQRFLSDLVRGGDFIYDIDLTSHGNNEIVNRVVSIPYSIVKAFDERKISLNIIAGGTSVTLRPGTFDTAQLRSNRDIGVGSRYIIKLSEASNYPPLSERQSYGNTPQNISFAVATPKKTINVTTTGADMNIDMKLDNRHTAMDDNVGAFYANSNTGGWARQDGKYNEVTGKISITSKKPGNYAIIASRAPDIAPSASNETVDMIYKLNTKLDIVDMTSIDPSAPIHPNQFNLIIYALSKGQKTINMNTPMTDAQITEMGRAGMLVSGGRVPLQNGVNAIVRLYENKVRPIRAYPQLSQSGFNGMARVSRQYQAAMLKAEEIGLLDCFTDFDPNWDMTFADLFYMLDIVIDDAGM